MKYLYILVLFAFIFPVYAQETRLEDCFRLAAANNLTLQQAHSTLRASELNLKAERRSYLPKVDLLSSYTLLSQPLEINFQEARSGIIDGSSRQSVNAANEVFRSITGTDLSQSAQDRIFQTSSEIMGALYPDYNPRLSQRSYFVAGIGFRQPLWLGNKLDAARNVAESVTESQRIQVDVAQKEINFLIAAQYLRILYLNTLLGRQHNIVRSLQKGEHYAKEAV